MTEKTYQNNSIQFRLIPKLHREISKAAEEWPTGSRSDFFKTLVGLYLNFHRRGITIMHLSAWFDKIVEMIQNDMKSAGE